MEPPKFIGDFFQIVTEGRGYIKGFLGGKYCFSNGTDIINKGTLTFCPPNYTLSRSPVVWWLLISDQPK